ncbi:MAG: VOC family protein, partial [Planctomycetaceae bacterium]|nr:VOC family protein [Planctomycetaceae bacterium]
NGKPSGSVMAVDFELNGSLFSALNGGQIPGFNFTPATSFMIRCQNQEEIDRYWAALSAVPEAEQCGWCTDKFGITWQVVPEILNELMSDPQKAERATKAFLPMKKFDLATLLEAV